MRKVALFSICNLSFMMQAQLCVEIFPDYLPFAPKSKERAVLSPSLHLPLGLKYVKCTLKKVRLDAPT